MINVIGGTMSIETKIIICPNCSFRKLKFNEDVGHWICTDCNSEYTSDYILGLNAGMKVMANQAKFATNPLLNEIKSLKIRYDRLRKSITTPTSKPFPRIVAISGNDAKRIIIHEEKRFGGTAKSAPKPSEITGDEYLLWTGAKIKKFQDLKTNQSRYCISGYTRDGSDVEKIIIWLHQFDPDKYV